MSSLSCYYLRCFFWSHWCNTIINRSNKRLWVECGKTRVSNTESSTISNVFNPLELAVGINIRVTSRYSSIGVTNFLLGRVQVCIPIVQISKLILSLKLAAGSIWRIWRHIWSWSDCSRSGCIWQSIRILSCSAGKKGRQSNKCSHDDVTCCEMLNDVVLRHPTPPFIALYLG